MTTEQINRIEQLKGETFAQLGVIFSGISQAELELAWLRRDPKAETLHDVVLATKAAAWAFRDQFKPTNAALTVDQARELQEKYKLEAAVALAEDEKISGLVLEREGLSRRIDFESRKLSAEFTEFYGIPVKVAKIDQEITDLQSSLEELNGLEAIFEQLYRSNLRDGKLFEELNAIGSSIATRPIRLKVLNEEIEKKQVERERLSKRNRELAKELKQTLHKL